MYRKMKNILFISIIVIVGSFIYIGCSEENKELPEKEPIQPEELDSGAFYSVSYIQVYVAAESFNVNPLDKNGRLCRLVAEGKRQSGEEFYTVFNDNMYKREIVPFSTEAIFNTFVAMDLVSDSDFDERHGAGTSLSDIVRFVGASAYDYIQSGCTTSYDWRTPPAIYETPHLKGWFCELGYAPVEKLLSELGKDDLVLIDPLFFLNFEKRPTLSKTHNLMLTVTDDKGKTLTAMWRQTFDD